MTELRRIATWRWNIVGSNHYISEYVSVIVSDIVVRPAKYCLFVNDGYSPCIHEESSLEAMQAYIKRAGACGSLPYPERKGKEIP